MDRGFLTDLTHTTEEGRITAEFGDIRRLQILTDKLKRLTHIMQLNSSICRQLQAFYKQISAVPTPEAMLVSCTHNTVMENCVFELNTHTARVRTLVERAEGIGSMVTHTSQVCSSTIG
jgi:hypothetical protein